jgi:hypothetical protein
VRILRWWRARHLLKSEQTIRAAGARRHCRWTILPGLDPLEPRHHSAVAAVSRFEFFVLLSA